ncbi:MAG: magnesium transporter [Candidatus Dadabacteria bacterium]|nr:MAG: magnesium transporter [Candidatus Dadabacteria bacterium]
MARSSSTKQPQSPSRTGSFVELKRPERLVKLLHRLLQTGQHRKIESILARLHPADIADILMLMPIPDTRELIRLLFRLRKGAATVAELPPVYMAELLEDFEPAMIAEFVRRIDPDDAADILQDLPDEKQHQVLQALEIDEVEELRQLLAYAEDTVGSIMNPDVFALPANLTVDEAIRKIRAEGEHLRNVVDVYVVDEEQQLVGVVSMRDLLLAPDEATLESIARPVSVTLTPEMSEDDAASVIARYDLFAVPVVDANEKLVGVVTVDDIVDVLTDAATEEIYSMAALDEDDRVFSPPLRSVRLRLPWLTLNFATALLAAFTVGLFEDVISQAVVLAAMMPIVAGMGGNSGSQTLTVMIRGIALGELKPVNARKALMKEVAVGLVNGIILAGIGFVIGWLWQDAWWLGLLLGLGILVNLVLAALAGALIPLTLKRLGLDPALGSTIILTTVTDVCGFFAFLGLARILLPLFGVLPHTS